MNKFFVKNISGQKLHKGQLVTQNEIKMLGKGQSMMIRTLIKIRNALSEWLEQFYKKTNWTPNVEGWTLNTLRNFIATNYEWVSDPVYGLLDHIQPIKHMNWQLKKYGVIKGDCDDLATYTIYLAMRIFGTKYTFRVNLISQQHVIGLFDANDGGWHWCSNHKISTFVGDHKATIHNYSKDKNFTLEALTLDDLLTLENLRWN